MNIHRTMIKVAACACEQSGGTGQVILKLEPLLITCSICSIYTHVLSAVASTMQSRKCPASTCPTFKPQPFTFDDMSTSRPLQSTTCVMAVHAALSC